MECAFTSASVSRVAKIPSSKLLQEIYCRWLSASCPQIVGDASDPSDDHWVGYHARVIWKAKFLSNHFDRPEFRTRWNDWDNRSTNGRLRA